MKAEDLYILFRKRQSAYLNRPYRLPKDVTKHINEKMHARAIETLKTAALFFDSKWMNVNPEEYLDCGFEIIGKHFTYHQFFDDRIMKLYIQRDKNKKREFDCSKQSIIDSTKFVLKYIKDKNISFITYLSETDLKQKVIIKNYLDNNISPLFFCYFLYLKKFVLTEEDKMFLPYISTQYRKSIPQIKRMEDFLIKIEEKLYEFKPVR